MPKEPTHVHDRTGTEKGKLTGGFRQCTLESCGGRKLGVRWPDGKLTFPCVRGMEIAKDGQWRIR